MPRGSPPFGISEVFPTRPSQTPAGRRKRREGHSYQRRLSLIASQLSDDVVHRSVQPEASSSLINRVSPANFHGHKSAPFLRKIQYRPRMDAQPPAEFLRNGDLPSLGHDRCHSINLTCMYPYSTYILDLSAVCINRKMQRYARVLQGGGHLHGTCHYHSPSPGSPVVHHGRNGGGDPRRSPSAKRIGTKTGCLMATAQFRSEAPPFKAGSFT